MAFITLSAVPMHFRETFFAARFSEVCSVTRLGDLLDFGQDFKVFGNN